MQGYISQILSAIILFVLYIYIFQQMQSLKKKNFSTYNI